MEVPLALPSASYWGPLLALICIFPLSSLFGVGGARFRFNKLSAKHSSCFLTQDFCSYLVVILMQCRAFVCSRLLGLFTECDDISPGVQH